MSIRTEQNLHNPDPYHRIVDGEFIDQFTNTTPPPKPKEEDKEKEKENG